MDNNTIKTVFKEYIHPLDSKVIQKMIDHAKIDKYVKKLDVLNFTNFFIYTQLLGLTSFERCSETEKRKKSVHRQIGLESISKLTTFLSKIFKEPERTSSGRQRPEHQRIFEETLAQYESGDVRHLDDLTYDPII